MTVRVVHAAAYSFPAPVTGLTLDLRLAPAQWERPRTLGSELSVVPPPTTVGERRDRWGNAVHRVSFERAVTRVAIGMHLTVATHPTGAMPLAVAGAGAERPAGPPSADDLTLPEDAPAGADLSVAGQAACEVVPHECASLTSGWRFGLHPAGEEVSLDELLRDRRGRCLELARLLVWRLRMRSIPARFVLGYALEPTARGAIRQRHAWVAYHDGGSWSAVDPSASDRVASDLFATAWGPQLAPLMPVRARRPTGLTGIVGTWSTQVTVA